MADERELKIRVGDFRALRRALRRAGASYLATVLQTDELYDMPSGDLRKADSVVRLRTQRLLRRGDPEFDARDVLTFKGPRRIHRAGLKIRPEHESVVSDADAVGRTLQALGAKRSLTIQKRRASYRLGPCRVELDELPLIGRFVEIEGPTDQAIAAAAQALGLTGPPVEQSYVELLVCEWRRLGRRGRAITF